MARRLIAPALAIAAIAVAVALLAPGSGPGLAPGGGQAAAQSSTVVETDAYVRDARRMCDALFAVGTMMQAIDSTDDLAARTDAVRRRLEAFRAAADELRGYRVERPVLERQRAAFVKAAPRVADAFDEVLDALEERDLVAVRAARADARRALQDFSRAARGKPPAAGRGDV